MLQRSIEWKWEKIRNELTVHCWIVCFSHNVIFGHLLIQKSFSLSWSHVEVGPLHKITTWVVTVTEQYNLFANDSGCNVWTIVQVIHKMYFAHFVTVLTEEVNPKYLQVKELIVTQLGSEKGACVPSRQIHYFFQSEVLLWMYCVLWPISRGLTSQCRVRVIHKSFGEGRQVTCYPQNLWCMPLQGLSIYKQASERYIWVKSKIYAFFYFRKILSPG